MQLCVRCKKEGYKNIIMRTSKELDLRRQDVVEEFFAAEKAGLCIFGSGKKLAVLWQTANTLPILCMTTWF